MAYCNAGRHWSNHRVQDLLGPIGRNYRCTSLIKDADLLSTVPSSDRTSTLTVRGLIGSPLFEGTILWCHRQKANYYDTGHPDHATNRELSHVPVDVPSRDAHFFETAKAVTEPCAGPG
jgi:hypothetical protein